jgi:hypothetical protein
LALLALYAGLCALLGLCLLCVGLSVLRGLHHDALHTHNLEARQILAAAAQGGFLALVSLVFTFNLKLAEALSGQVVAQGSYYRLWILASVAHSKLLALAFGTLTGYLGTATYRPDNLSPSTAALAGFCGALIFVVASSASQLAVFLVLRPQLRTSFLYFDWLLPAHFEMVAQLWQEPAGGKAGPLSGAKVRLPSPDSALASHRVIRVSARHSKLFPEPSRTPSLSSLSDSKAASERVVGSAV